MTICDSPDSAGSISHLTTVTVCDAAGICNEFPLTATSFDTGDNLITTYDNLVANSFSSYEDYLVSATINSDSEDGFCVKEWSLNGYSLLRNVDLSDSFWVDGDCTGHINGKNSMNVEINF